MFVYLHGFASGPSSSKALFFRERLAETGRELLIPELDGGDFENLTISGQLSIVEDTVRGRDVVLIGSSMGGYLAGLYAATHANVSRMLLLAPAFGFTERWPSSLGETQAAEWKATGRLPVYHYGRRRQASLHYGLLEDAAKFPAFPGFEQPALILHGRQDDVVPISYSETYAQSHPNVTLVAFDCGHEMLGALPDIWRYAEPFLNQA